MTFSTPIFLFLFLPLTLLLVYISKPVYRNSVLLLVSLFFYTWGEHIFVFVLLASVFINFIFGHWIENPGKFLNRKIILWFCIGFNLSLIIYFKYFSFLYSNLNPLLKALNFNIPISYQHVVLPIGISFFTFQNISYIVDVYRKQVQPEKKILNYSLYISFFPHLIAGPIVRYADIAGDISKRTFDYSRLASGIQRFILGLSKKVLIANTMALVADRIFDLPLKSMNTPLAWLAIIAYSLQIYFDFSGYSDMAIGLSRMFGFNFLENFNYPYIATSVTDFWKRWHMSLSLWFRDYVYIPLGGNRHGKFRTYLNLIIVFFLTGLWHGASWNFIIWGMIHGFFMLLERIGGNKVTERLGKAFAHLYLLTVVMLAWVFFRIENFTTAIEFIKTLFGEGKQEQFYTIWFYLTNEVAVMLIAGIFFSMPVYKLVSKLKISKMLSPQLINLLYLLLLFLSVLELAAGTYNPFIYSRF